MKESSHVAKGGHIDKTKSSSISKGSSEEAHGTAVNLKKSSNIMTKLKNFLWNAKDFIGRNWFFIETASLSPLISLCLHNYEKHFITVELGIYTFLFLSLYMHSDFYLVYITLGMGLFIWIYYEM